jgi:D-serine deaminase-like pyridoxal phosphate-dependent protein
MANVSTPYLLINAARVERNIHRLATYSESHGLRVRPHTKTHKSLDFARQQLSSYGAGLTVAKPSEAEVMTAVADDLLVAYPLSDPAKISRLLESVGRGRLMLPVDSLQSVEALGAAAESAGKSVGILVDLDVGFGRTGVQSARASLDLARVVVATRGLQLRGIFCYPGHVWAMPAEQGKPLHDVSVRLREAIDVWRKDGLEAPVVSGGSTPTAYQSHLIPELTEIRPGTYVFNDMNTAAGGFCELEDCAATLECTVVSNAVPGKVIIDAGTKALTADRNVTKPDSGYGFVVEYPTARITRLSEEHGEVDISNCDHAPRIGDRVHVIPNHICPCVNLQNHFYIDYGGGQVERLSVHARGMLA